MLLEMLLLAWTAGAWSRAPWLRRIQSDLDGECPLCLSLTAAGSVKMLFTPASRAMDTETANTANSIFSESSESYSCTTVLQGLFRVMT
jgi:hypothetical protein